MPTSNTAPFQNVLNFLDTCEEKKVTCTCVTKKLGNVTILAGLSFVAPGAEACVVADAHARVFARRFANRLGVKNEADGDAARRVRTRGANAGKSHQGDS